MLRSLSTAIREWRQRPDLPPTTHLCKSCKRISITQYDLKDMPTSKDPDGSVSLELLQGPISLPVVKKDLYPGFPALKRVAEAGCDFCAALLEAIQKHSEYHRELWKENVPDGRVVIRFQYNCTPEIGLRTIGSGQWLTMLSSLTAHIEPTNRYHGPKSIAVIFKLHCDPDSIVGRYLQIHRRRVESSTMAQNNVQMVNTWMQDCHSNHRSCTPSATDKIRTPTRLIHIGSCNSQSPPRLVLYEEIPQRLTYAALSYCWGPPSSIQLTTTKDTVEAQKSGIVWDSLPLTIRDTFLVARDLHIDYVWIDALCIIQDDEDDWTAEAAIMGDIYRGAYVTFVAASSESANDGFLSRIKPCRSVLISFESSVHQEVVGHYYLTFSEQGDMEDFDRDVEWSTWNKRGWTFQERLLSPKILFFGKHRIYFECREHQRMEGYEGALRRKLPMHKQLQDVGNWDMLDQLWKKIIEEYSTRTFTYSRDRLIALAGVASDFSSKAKISGSERPIYLTGHWNTNLELSFLWFTDGEAHTKDESNQEFPRVPSWSWCAKLRKVSWPPLDLKNVRRLCNIVNLWTATDASDMPGTLTSGTVDIKGPLARLYLPLNATNLKDKKSQRLWYELRRSGAYYEVNRDRFRRDPIMEQFLGRKHFLYQLPPEPMYTIYIALDEHTYLEEFFWLALICETVDTGSQTAIHQGIVMTSSPASPDLGGDHDLTPKTAIPDIVSFRRCGYFRIKGETGGLQTTLESTKYGQDLVDWLPQSVGVAFGFQNCVFRVL